MWTNFSIKKDGLNLYGLNSVVKLLPLENRDHIYLQT